MDLTPHSKIDEERVRADIGAALIQAGYGDASDEEDLLEWHFCFERRECPGQRGEPCACAGTPFVSDKVWASLRPVLDKISDARYRAGREDAARAAELVFPTSTDTLRAFLARHRMSDTPSVGAVSVALLADVREAISLGRSAGGVGDNPEEQRR